VKLQVFRHWRIWVVNRCGDDNIIDVDNGDDGGDTINRHFAENQDHSAQSLGSATVTIYVLV
jgi:hypothetical protein